MGCNSGVCDVPTAGEVANNSSTDGYMKNGDIPSFKIYDSSEDMYYDAIASEEFVWENFGFKVIESLGAEIAEIATSYQNQDYQHTGTSYRKGNAQDWFYRETGCIQYLIEAGHSDTDNNIYDQGLLIEEDHLNEVIDSNIDAFFHLLMRAGGKNYNSVDGNHQSKSRCD